jgi:hypothetical protein
VLGSRREINRTNQGQHGDTIAFRGDRCSKISFVVFIGIGKNTGFGGIGPAGSFVATAFRTSRGFEGYARAALGTGKVLRHILGG